MGEQPNLEVIRRSMDAARRCLVAGMIAEAESLCESVLRVSPAEAAAHACLADCADARGDLPGRQWRLALAAAFAPDDPEHRRRLESEVGDASDLMRAAVTEALIAHIRAGNLTAAGADARAALERDPDFVFGWKILGASLMHAGEVAQAVEALRRATVLQPDDSEAHANLADALQHLGDAPGAIASAERALELDAGMREAYLTMARARIKCGDWSQAAGALRSALALQMDDEEAQNLLGEVQRHLELQAPPQVKMVRHGVPIRSHGARKADAKSLRRAREELVKLFNAKQFSALESAARRWVERYPEVGFHWHALGLALSKLGRSDESLAPYREAIRVLPDDAELQNNYGIALEALGRIDEAAQVFAQARDCAPEYLPAQNNLGLALQKKHRFVEAEQIYRRILERDPNHLSATRNLGNVLKDMGRLSEGLAWYRKSVEMDRQSFESWSNLLFSSNYLGTEPVESMRQLAVDFANEVVKAHGSRLPSRTQAKKCSDSLRVGFVSGDLHAHPVAYFLEHVLAHLDRSKITPLAYATYTKTDAVTDRLRPHFAGWRRLIGVSDTAAAELIIGDGVDVLIDLSGHSGYNRLPMFVYRPAPLQVTWLGYFATTGLPEIDYILGDAYVTPASEGGHFVERVWRLPDAYLCFSVPDFDIDPGPLPWLANGYPTFGCFNNLPKLNDQVIDLWCQIMIVVPDARLFLKTRQLGDATIRAETQARFAARGVDPARLIMEGHAPRAELLASYRRVDVCLDPFPYPGGTTSIEAMWMGVPVITRRGDRFLSHVGETIAHNAGMHDWIADDDSAYLVKAIATCANPDALAELRAGLRVRVLSSPLFDAERFARNFEAALFGMWREKFGEKT